MLVPIQLIGKLNGCVQSDPAHELGIEEMLWTSAHLPDTLIRLLPAGSGGMSSLNQKGACGRV